MSQEEMKVLVNIADWYASPLDTFIQVYNMDKAPHALSKFSMDKLVMQEVAYHMSTRLSTRLHRNKNAPWPALPLRIGLYEIQNLKHVEAEMEQFKRFAFNNRSFNPYDLHRLVENQCTRVYHPWIHGACQRPEEDPWRYCYNLSRLNEPVRMVVE